MDTETKRILYDKVMEAAKSTDHNLFASRARNWVEEADDAPFGNQEAENYFQLAKMQCAAWRSNVISSRVSFRRMVENIRRIADMNLPNPYKEEVVLEEPVVVTGDLEEEEEDHRLFGKRKKR